MGITRLPSFVHSRSLGLIHSTPRLRTHLLGYTASKPIRSISTQAPEVVQAAFKDMLADQSNLLHYLQLDEDVTSVRILRNLRTARNFAYQLRREPSQWNSD